MKFVQTLACLIPLVFSGCGIGLCLDVCGIVAPTFQLVVAPEAVTVRRVGVELQPVGGTVQAYKAVYSLADNISTPALAEQNGTLVLDWGPADSFSVPGLSPNSKIYFAAWARDFAGNVGFATGSATTVEFCGGGPGTSSGDAWQICDLAQLNSIRDDLAGFYQVMNSIDASGTASWNQGKGWEPIGQSDAPFVGGFDGGHYVVRALTLNRPDENYVGFFGYAENSVNSIANIGFTSASVVGKTSVGVLAGHLRANPVIHAYSLGSVTGISRVGGLIGSVSSSAVISYSFSTANVSADTIAGGLVGGSLDPGSTLTDTYARGRVAAQSVAGGLIGETHGLVSRSHARADVLGSESGGMVGRLSDNTASIEFSIANGNVVGQEKVGGLLGATSNNAVVRYSVATGHVQGTAQSGGLVGSSESGALAVSYSFSTGKVFSAASSKGALIGESAGAVLTRNLAYDHGHGLTCTEAGTHANCNLAITGTFTPDDLRFSPELEFVELKRQESVPIALRKISLSDQAAYRVWGRCKEHGQSVSITATGGGTVNAQAECTAFTWEQSLNLSALPDGPVEISVTDGTVTRVLYLTKETAYCNSPSRVGIHYANDGEAGINGLSVGNAFAICTPEQFQNIRNNPAGTYYFKLMNNLDFEAESSNPSSSFTFRLDGNGFLVRRAVVVAPTVNIGILRGFQTVANVGIEESHVTGDRDIGLVTQFLGGGALLSDAYASGTVLAMTYAGGSGAGGLVGSVHGGVVSGVASFADVTGFDVGGAFAIIGQGSAARSISQGNVIARRVGGGFACRIGNVFVTGSVVTQSAATGHVVGLSSGADEFGGFAASIIYNVPLVENNRASGSVLSPALNLGGFVAINSPFGTSFSVTLRNNLATGHVLGGNSTGNHSAFSGGLGSWIGGPTLLIQDAVALGHVQSPAVDLGAILGQSTNTDATGSTVTTSYFWAHPGMPIPCIDNNSNMTDPVTCNDVEIPSFYQNLSNFTSATSVYANWDFVNEWKFPAAGGTPLLRWE